MPAHKVWYESRTLLSVLLFVGLLVVWVVLLKLGVAVPEWLPPGIGGLFAVVQARLRFSTDRPVRRKK
mgnify:CR=1 FL=1